MRANPSPAPHALKRSIVPGLFAGALLFIALACDDNDDGRDSTRAPSPVATSATPVATIFPSSEGGEDQLLLTLACADDGLTITTTLRTIRAALPCDRLPPLDVIERFQQEPTEVEVRPAPPAKILLRADEAGSLEFTVEDIRVEEQ